MAEHPAFKPSQVFLNTVPPLTATMGRSEREHAAALLVRTCQVKGDAWQPVTPAMLGEVLRADLGAQVEPWNSLNRNPFFRPDFHDLVAAGFARWGDDTVKGPLELTELGIESLRRWVRATQEEASNV
jgi:hypothetical protein